MRIAFTPKSFAEYLQNIPEETKPKLLELMAIIKEVASQAQEAISYRMLDRDNFSRSKQQKHLLSKIVKIR